jgi:hypothetical protein
LMWLLGTLEESLSSTASSTARSGTITIGKETSK